MSLLERYQEVPLTKLVEASWNYKKTDDKKSAELMEKLKSNLKKNKQIENLIIREKSKGKFEVVNGNHRLRALKSIKVKNAICFNLGKITQAEAERIAIETNETKFEADPIKYAEMIQKLAKEFSIEGLIDTLPMNRDEIENYAKLLEFDWSLYEKQLDDVDDGSGEGEREEGHEEWETIEFRLPLDVANLWYEQVNRFKRAINPDKEPESTSNVPAVECMIAHLSEIPEEMLFE